MAFKGMMTAPPPPPPTLPQTTLEVTVVSGESVRLRSDRALGRGAYAVVHTPSSFAITRVDEDADCGGYPFWDEAVLVELPAGARGLDVEICRSRGAGAGRGESVAAARVPVEDFSVGPPGHLHCLSYRLFDTGGMRGRNGIVNITVKRLGGVGVVLPAPMDDGKPPLPMTGKKAVLDAGGANGSGSCCGFAAGEQGKPAAPAGVVIGYPVGSVGMPATGHADGKGCV